MAFSFIPKINQRHAKKGRRVNPHQFWNIYIVAFLLTLILITVGVTAFFVRTTNRLDAVVLPRLDTGIRPVEKIKQRLDKAEKAVQDRVGENSNQ